MNFSYFLFGFVHCAVNAAPFWRCSLIGKTSWLCFCKFFTRVFTTYEGSTPSTATCWPSVKGRFSQGVKIVKICLLFSRLFWRYSSTAASSRKSKIMDQSILVTSGFQFMDDGSTPSIASGQPSQELFREASSQQRVRLSRL